MRYRTRRGPGRFGRVQLPIHLLIFLLVASLVTGWIAGRLWAVGERPPFTLSVYRHDIGETVHMSLDDYVKGVVAAEMPVEFHEEALKAQAVAARTLALSLWEAGQPLPDHPDAVISTDSGMHQAWVSPEELRERWGPLSFFTRWSKITRAVAATRGLVLTYNGSLIYPAYHSSSGGRTEDSENYWSGYSPYLRSVDDPYVAGSRYEKTEAVIAKADIERALSTSRSGSGESIDRAATTAGAPYIEVLSRFPSGRVQWVRVGAERRTGRELRELLGLRSNWFDVTDLGDAVRFEVRGYGHGIGMSQYGAEGMARAGFTFDQILEHYYTGVELVVWHE